MKRKFFVIPAILGLMFLSVDADAQYKDKQKKGGEEDPTLADEVKEQASASESPLEITLEQAVEIALSENVAVKVADMEIKRNEYARKGTYAALIPQIDLTGSYQRTIKRQVMYMDIDIDMPEIPGMGNMPSMDEGMEVGRLNTLAFGVSVAMPIINAQLWKSVQMSKQGIELAIEKARSSKLETITQVKQAYFSTLLAKEAFNVYKQVYENALSNYNETENKVKVQKASEMDLLRAKTTVANAIPNVYNAESNIALSLWQLKAVMGVELDLNIDVTGHLDDYSEQMFRDIHENDDMNLSQNSTMKQLEIQSEQLAQMVKLKKFAYIPTLGVGFNFSYNTMANDVPANQFRWTPYSYVGVSLTVPICSGGKRLQDVRIAKNQHAQLQYQISDTERKLKIAVQSHLNKMETNMKSYYAAKDAVEMAQKSYNIVCKSYEVGRSTLLDLNDAQLALTQAQLGQYQAIYNFVSAKADLEQVIGAEVASKL